MSIQNIIQTKNFPGPSAKASFVTCFTFALKVLVLKTMKCFVLGFQQSFMQHIKSVYRLRDMMRAIAHTCLCTCLKR